MTMQEVLEAVRSGKLSVADAGKVLPAGKSPGNKRIIKRNSSGGLFVMDASFRCFSKAKNKTYTGSFNMDKDVAKALFTNPELLAEIAAFVTA